MSRAILVTGATGNQGGAVIDAVLSRKPSDFLLLGVTRNAKSPSAQSLAAKSTSSIRLVEGDLDSTARLFESAKQVAGTVPLWGVAVMIDESIKAGVQHFVYSSVERGGDERSWDNPTPVPHFKTKHEIEHYLRDTTARKSMGWTILRPVIFMDNLVPGFPGKVFMTMLRDTIKDKPLQWIATKDIGFFAAEAFHDPKTWNKRAVGLAGDVLTFSQLSDTFQRATGRPSGATLSLLGKALKHGVAEMGLMVDWFRDEGYGADMAKIEKVHPSVTKMETWLKNSAFVNSK
ncbi:related to nucleoside-diphosphate-sugar epimerases [Fusarium oxysporum]|uniref:Related to nucleoside-diphosphate-sugar epimerases n=1 Tax=Fusarium oxysporum TaxID=5507 RepID=A0A2H3T521_FUSOX|nr:related to nucleoside-diphosphate-sugar epimerases [Fusarium oxysporum]